MKTQGGLAGWAGGNTHSSLLEILYSILKPYISLFLMLFRIPHLNGVIATDSRKQNTIYENKTAGTPAATARYANY